VTQSQAREIAAENAMRPLEEVGLDFVDSLRRQGAKIALATEEMQATYAELADRVTPRQPGALGGQAAYRGLGHPDRCETRDRTKSYPTALRPLRLHRVRRYRHGRPGRARR